MVWALSVEHFPTLSLWSQHGTQSWIILGNFSILAKNHHWKKQMIGSYRIYFETCTAYWHCLRFSRQSALVCSDYSLDPKKTRGPDQQQNRGHFAWLGLRKTCWWAVAWFLPCSTMFCRINTSNSFGTSSDFGTPSVLFCFLVLVSHTFKALLLGWLSLRMLWFEILNLWEDDCSMLGACILLSHESP